MLKSFLMSRAVYHPCPNVNVVGALMDIEKEIWMIDNKLIEDAVFLTMEMVPSRLIFVIGL